MVKINIKDRKLLMLFLGLIIVSVFTLTIAYAALNAVLTINGSAEVNSSTWDVYLANPRVSSGSATSDVPIVKSKHSVEFSTTLNMPGDYYEFVIDAVNGGSIDAVIENVVKTPELTVDQAKYINYVVSYENGEGIDKKQILSKDSQMPIKVRVEYRRDISASDLPAGQTVLDLSITLEYTQSDGTGNIVNNNGVYVDLEYPVGREICFDSECFYVISSTEESVTMLAKYNLYVGGVYDSSTGTWTAYGDDATGKQDSTMLGYVSGQSKRNGTAKFSNTNYWKSTVSSYPAYVYDSNSTLYSYVENYKTYLSTLGVTPIEARLITKDELISDEIGCSDTGYTCTGSAYPWIYSTSYWIGSAFSTIDVSGVLSSGSLSIGTYSSAGGFGVRPVIIVSKDDIIVSSIIEFTIDDITYQAEEGMSWGEWIESKYNFDEFCIDGGGSVSYEGVRSVYEVNSNSFYLNSSDIIKSGGQYHIGSLEL